MIKRSSWAEEGQSHRNGIRLVRNFWENDYFLLSKSAISDASYCDITTSTGLGWFPSSIAYQWPWSREWPHLFRSWMHSQSHSNTLRHNQRMQKSWNVESPQMFKSQRKCWNVVLVRISVATRRHGVIDPLPPLIRHGSSLVGFVQNWEIFWAGVGRLLKESIKAYSFWNLHFLHFSCWAIQ